MFLPILLRACLIAAIFWSLDLAVFHTALYRYVMEPDSTTGNIESRIRSEVLRAKGDRNQVVAVGNSRMALNPRLANALIHETGYTFASISVGGTMPRCWYYQLRAVDPTARAYAAVIVPSDDYDEPDEFDNPVERPVDLNYMLAEVRLGDAPEFAGSFATWRTRFEMARSIFFKGLVYRRDFEELLLHPVKRMEDTAADRENAASWAYTFDGEDVNLAGLTVDWEHGLIHFPGKTSPELQEKVRALLLRGRPAQAGVTTRYCRYWYGRILDYYRGSGTKVIFMQVPRWPVANPASVKHNPDSAARGCRTKPGAIVFDEQLLEDLERPELFMDAVHLNREGMYRFTGVVAREVRRVLGPGHPPED